MECIQIVILGNKWVVSNLDFLRGQLCSLRYLFLMKFSWSWWAVSYENSYQLSIVCYFFFYRPIVCYYGFMKIRYFFWRRKLYFLRTRYIQIQRFFFKKKNYLVLELNYFDKDWQLIQNKVNEKLHLFKFIFHNS